MAERSSQVGALVLHRAAVQFRHHRAEQNLLFSVGIDSYRALLVLARLIPNRQRREARLMADKIDLKRIDYLDVGDRRIGDRHAAQLGREVDNPRSAGLYLD